MKTESQNPSVNGRQNSLRPAGSLDQNDPGPVRPRQDTDQGRIPQRQGANPTPRHPILNSPQPPRRRRWILPLVLALVSLLLIGGALAYYFYTRSDSPTETTAETSTGPGGTETLPGGTETLPGETDGPPEVSDGPETASSDAGAELLRSLTQSPEFQQSTLEEQALQVVQALQQLQNEGIIRSDVQFSEAEQVFSFHFTNGILGGVCLRDMDNTGSAQNDVGVSDMSVRSMPNVKGLILNGFEDTPFRRDFYREMQRQWADAGNYLELDEDVTVNDFRRLDEYDYVVFSMHGFHYKGKPILSLHQKVTAQSDQALDRELRQTGSVAKVFCTDGEYHYWLLPDFFYENYSAGSLHDLVVFSESCCFAGCDCGGVDPENSMARALTDSGAAVVIGYHNSVMAVYSRDVMKMTLAKMSEGQTAQYSLDCAKSVYGASDGHVDDSGHHDTPAYPVLYGDPNAVLYSMVTPEPPPQVEWDPPYTVLDYAPYRTLDENAYFYLEGGRQVWSYIQQLDTPVENCTGVCLHTNISDLTEGTVLGEWGFYVREPDGNWRYVTPYTLYSYEDTTYIAFPTPISFDAYCCPCHCLGDSWYFHFNVWLTDLVCGTSPDIPGIAFNWYCPFSDSIVRDCEAYDGFNRDSNGCSYINATLFDASLDASKSIRIGPNAVFMRGCYFVPQIAKPGKDIWVSIYLDGELVWFSDSVTNSYGPVWFELDLSGGEVLTIETGNSGTFDSGYLVFGQTTVFTRQH